MIDISDGFLGDLGHICEESLVGAEIHKEKCPISRDLQQAARVLENDPYDFFLGDSDDYELIITCPPGHVDDIAAVVSSVSSVPVTEVGSITSASAGMQLIVPDGKSRPVSPSGWDHFSA
jgi:thiamine-monophosphate kinase